MRQDVEKLQTESLAGNKVSPRHPVFIALRETIREFDIPRAPFADLLTAFRQDQTITRYPTFEDVLGYCKNSANPVGHLVLYLCGYRDAERQQLSDYTCTALQLANFWQDVAVDYGKGRIYLPLESLAKFGVSESDIADRRATPQFREMMKFEVARARDWFRRGLPLAGKVDKHLAIDIELFSRGGLAILDAIERQDYDVLSAGPLSPSRASCGCWRARRWAGIPGRRSASTGARGGKGAVSEHPLQLRAAYSVCRHIARSAAKNFYYGFLLLPHRKRNALSAVYAFMRHADDISDDPSIPAEQRRQKLEEWMKALRRGGGWRDAPTIRCCSRWPIRRSDSTFPSTLLEKLVQGTEMDVPAEAQVVPQLQYETFDQLYDYCYHVASVVGLVCIRIFGYRDPRAEKLAEEVGVAFQLTNILRDVKEDAGSGAGVPAARGFCALWN